MPVYSIFQMLHTWFKDQSCSTIEKIIYNDCKYYDVKTFCFKWHWYSCIVYFCSKFLFNFLFWGKRMNDFCRSCSHSELAWLVHCIWTSDVVHISLSFKIPLEIVTWTCVYLTSSPTNLICIQTGDFNGKNKR